ncbi:MAG: hypothetical protein WCD73_20550, partial [Pseudolabrys sp.]
INTKTKRAAIASDARNCDQPVDRWDEPDQLQSTHVEGDEHELATSRSGASGISTWRPMKTSRPEASWHVVPADNKWFTRLVAAAEVVEALDRLNLKFPSVTGVGRRELDRARKILRNSR